MSLIDEALKRARQEAAQQDEAAREKRWRQVPVIPTLRVRPRRSSRLLWIVIGACLILGLGIAIGLTLVPFGPRKPNRQAHLPPEPVAVVAAPVQATAPPPLPAEQEEPPAAPVPEAEELAPPPTEKATAQEAAPPPPVQLAPPPPPPAPVPAAPEPAPPAPVPATSPAPPPVRTYQQAIPLPGGGILQLNGIVFSGQPVALFGDKVVAQGESVAGYRVVAIEPRRVRLAGEGGEVVIELP